MDPAIDQQAPQQTPQQPIPPVNTTVQVNAEAPPPVPTVPPNVSSQLQAPAPPQLVGTNPAETQIPSPPKETFAQGFHREANPTFTTDAEGNVISTEPAVRTSPKGILGRILAGALEGAARGMSAQPSEGAMGEGAAFSAAANQAIKERLAQRNRAREIAQQNFQNQQVARAAKIKQQLDLAQEAMITQNMEFTKEEHPGVMRAQKLHNTAAELQIRGLNQTLVQNGLDFRTKMAEIGVDPTPFFSSTDPAFLAQGYALAHGQEKMVHNGGTGDNNGIDTYNTAELQNKILTAPETYYTYDGGVDKNGAPIATPHVLTPDGKTTALDYFNNVMKGRSQLVQMQQRISAQMTLEQHEAAIKEQQAKAAQEQSVADLNEAYATGKLLKPGEIEMYGLPGTGNAQNGIQGVVDLIGSGRMDIGRASYLLARNPMLVQLITQKYPDFKPTMISGFTKLASDYLSGKTSQQFVNGTTALKHLWDLKQLNTPQSLVPGTPDHTAYMNQLNTVIDELMQFYGVSASDEKIKLAQQTLGALLPMNRNAAIEQQASNMGERFTNWEQKWRDGIPSPVFQNQNPLKMDAEAQRNLNALDRGFAQKYPNSMYAVHPQGPTNIRVVKIGGRDFTVGADGTFIYGNQQYRVNPDGKGATLVQGH